MSRSKVVHSDDATTIIIKGNKSSPEPSTSVIKFPGGLVEVSRTSDGKYWAHIKVDESANIVGSRIGYDRDGYEQVVEKVPHVPMAEKILHMAIKVDGPYRSTETL